MKIKLTESSFAKFKPVQNKNILPKRQNIFLKKLAYHIFSKVLRKYDFRFDFKSGDDIPDNEPVLILMNHSSFIDIEILHVIFAKRSLSIATTDDAFIGKDRLLRRFGCIPALKFQNDIRLISNLKYAVEKLKSSPVIFPEATYSFDGTNGVIPSSIAGLVKCLNIPVIMVRTHGAFLHDPLYNGLQVRKTNISAEVSCIIDKERLLLPRREIFEIIKENFRFDYFKEQQDNNIIINEPFRCDHLNRVLYKCPHCLAEGGMDGKGVAIKCLNCGNSYELTENGYLVNKSGKTLFNHIPDWYKWQKQCISETVEQGTYSATVHGDIYAATDHKSLYKLGEGSLNHNMNGLTLYDDMKNTLLTQSALACYSLYSDFYWYEIGDIVSIGTPDVRYYIVPKEKDTVAKFRIAVEGIYKYALKNRDGYTASR